jgi:5-oxopent-3-ene-1,2,5-tricarboxylate decarboxylase / 2-hydroxyhepta-2,4-diene-1,7-dioate isomerase
VIESVLKPGSTVYTAVLNFRGAVEALGGALEQPPYQKPPQAPVLFIKPPSTWIGDGDAIPCPPGVSQLRMGGTLAVVIGRTARQIREEDALDYVRGYTIANDVSIPHDSYYRPPVKERCRDGFCPVHAKVVPLGNPDAVEIRIFVNGQLRATNTTAHLIRPVARLLAGITEFVTLHSGDLVLVGEPENAPLASPGDVVRVELDSVGLLENTIAEEASL